MSYVEHSLGLSPAQVKKMSRGEKVRISHANLSGSHPAYLTKSQYNRVKRAMEKGVGVDLQFSSKQISHNVKHGGSLFSDVKNLLKGQVGKVKDIVEDLADEYDVKGKAKDALRKGIDYGLQKGSKLVKDKVEKELEKRGMGWKEDLLDAGRKYATEQAGNALRSGLNYGINKGSDLLTSQVDALLKQRLGLGRKKKGQGFLSDTLGAFGLGMKDRRYRGKPIVPIEQQVADQSLNQQVQGQQQGKGFMGALLAPVAVNMALKQLGMGKKPKKEKKGGFLGPLMLAKAIGLGKKKSKKQVEGGFLGIPSFIGDTFGMARDIGLNVAGQALANKLSGKGRRGRKAGGSFKLGP